MASYEMAHPEVVAETIEGEAVVINLERGSYFSMRNSGLAVWSAACAGLPTDRIVAAVVEHLGADPAEAEAEVERFLATLVDEGLVRPRQGSGATPAPLGLAGFAAASPYVAPEFEKFTDMEALLLLDPIHDVDEAGWPHRQ